LKSLWQQSREELRARRGWLRREMALLSNKPGMPWYDACRACIEDIDRELERRRVNERAA
jgi:hypothetical protein